MKNVERRGDLFGSQPLDQRRFVNKLRSSRIDENRPWIQ